MKEIVPLHKRVFNPQPMTNEESVAFMSLLMNEFPEDKIVNNPMYQIISNRFETALVEVDVNTKVFITMLSPTPGVAVLYCYSIAHMYKDNGGRMVTMHDLANSFPNGFLSPEDLEKAWDDQKVTGEIFGDNALDILETWPTVR